MRAFVCLFVAGLLSGCATQAKFEENVKSMMGMSEDEVIQKLGAPNGFYQTADMKYLTFSRARSGYVPGTAPNYQTQVIGNTAYTQAVGGSPGYSYTTTCALTLGFRDGRAATYRYEGNACRSR